MKKIFFKQIKVRNFLSIGTKEINLPFTPGINLITGVNLDKEDASNGTGKSSLIESIYFSLYGKTLRDLKIDQIPNSYTKGPCEAVLDFDINDNGTLKSYTVIRSLRPTKLLLFENGNDITKSTIVQTTELLQDIISCSNTVFENSVIMGANNATSFMSQKKVEKRKFLEGILNLTVFGEMLSVAREDYNNTKWEYDLDGERLKESENNLNIFKQQSDKYNSAKLVKQQEINDKIADVQDKIVKLSEQLKQESTSEEIKDLKEKFDKLQNAKSSYTITSKALIKEETGLEHTKRSIEAEVNKLINVPDVCNECDRPYTNVDRESIQRKCEVLRQQVSNIENKIQFVKDQIQTNDNQFKKIELALTALVQKQDAIKNISKHNENINWKIEQLDSNLLGLQKDLNAVNTETVDYTNAIQEHNEKVDSLKLKIQESNTRLETLQAAKFILSEEGIRSYIVKKILRILNSKLNMYLKKLDANTKCEFNEYFEETLWDQYGNERSYHNFSNGEQRRIDLAILFAFQDIRKLQADVSMNISIYDELLDSSLDRKGAELVLFLLKERADKNNECVYIVSHRREAQSSHTNKIITLQKKNGITTLAE